MQKIENVYLIVKFAMCDIIKLKTWDTDKCNITL